jgi:murein DD-endopeptidase MepM/ murein hydrolase activator NlpD
MRHSKFVYISRDHTTVKEFDISRLKILIYTTIFAVMLVVCGKFGVDFLVEFTRTSDIIDLEQKNSFLTSQIREMQDQVKEINKQLADIEEKDDELRLLMDTNEISKDVREVGIGGTDYSFNLPDNLLNPEESEDIIALTESLDKLQREAKLESESFMQIEKTYYAKKDSFQHMPSMNPVLEGRVSSDFGRRLHPILNIWHQHDGIDIVAKHGAPVYAPADGVVKFIGKYGAYGNLVVIDHKTGFVTKYGHLSKIIARSGQTVKRGDRIGEVGKTGRATNSHLHYEILFNGKNLNPKDTYFFDYELNKLAVNE